ncbi:hypothetical protein HDU88_005281 [Geranomyces variabilis]|nr:hypothetical protein HDU88_005281 [Geranomyces variabilis]
MAGSSAAPPSPQPPPPPQPEEIVVSPTVSPSPSPSPSPSTADANNDNHPMSSCSNTNNNTAAAAAASSIKAGEKACVDDYSSTPPDKNPPPAVRCKIYFNRLLTPANKREPYPVYQLQLHDVAHFFSPPPALRKSADSAVDVKAAGRKLPRRLANPVAKLLQGIEAVVHPSAKRAAERERLRKVLGASLLTQEYNDKAPRIKATFAETPQGLLARATARAVHRKMYGKGIFFGPFKRREKSWISTGDELLDVIEKHGGKPVHDDDDSDVKPSNDSAPPPNAASSSSPSHPPPPTPPPSENVSKSEKKARETAQRKLVRSPAGPEYTYTLLADGVLHFSRADTPILNIASKHMMHSSCARQVVYAGTMRIEAQKTNNNDEDKERIRRFLIMDNDSGTYAPRCDRAELRRLRDLMQWNFPGLIVLARKYVPAGMEKELGDDNGTDGCGGGIVEAEESERAAEEAGTTTNSKSNRREAPGDEEGSGGGNNGASGAGHDDGQ